MKTKRPFYTTEEQAVHQKALIITEYKSIFVHKIRSNLQQYSIDVFISSALPERLNPYTVICILNPGTHEIRDCAQYPSKRFIFIFLQFSPLIKKFTQYVYKNKIRNVKVIHMKERQMYIEEDIDKIFWFSFSRSSEIYLHIYHPDFETKKPAPAPKRIKKRTPFLIPLLVKISKPSVLLQIILLFLFTLHLLFIPPLLFGTGLNYIASKKLIQKEFSQATDFARYSEQSMTFSKFFYQYARPTLLLFSVASFPDNLFEINRIIHTIVMDASEMEEKGKKIASLFFKKEKTQFEIDTIHNEIKHISEDIETLNRNLSVLEEKIPAWSEQMKIIKNHIRETNEIIHSAQKFLPFFDDIFGKNDTKTYLLLFANNMELRPGGGFIGSFGTITMKNYSIHDIKVYDVYDADGQLKAHVPPPDPIRDYLDQPHWFLRDSAFSPDFYTNYQQAQFFLEKEMNMKNFDGCILLTTTAIQYILDAVGDVYVPEFRETVNADNFYIKAQLYAEKDFFPGSLQKKRFLKSVFNQLLLQLEIAPLEEIFRAIKLSFNEKQIVAYFDDSDIQTLINDMYWSGRIITQDCPPEQTENCIVDYLFPYDANLGVNKANFFISRTKDFHVKVDADGNIENTYTTRIVNNSYENIFPGGRYKNYFQILLPLKSDVTSLSRDGKKITDYDETNDVYKKIGFLMNIPPKSESVVKLTYTLNTGFQKGSGMYQVVIQKQIGSPNSDFQFMVEMPDQMYMVAKNFNPLVNNKTILYNTTLSTDKIFVLEFFKE